MRERLLQLARFIAVGLFGTFLYAGLAFAFKWSGLSVFGSHALASAISLVASYFGQKIFTFRIAGDHARRGTRFFIATAGLVTVQSLMVYLMDRAGVPTDLILAASTVYYPPASYLVHTFWTFRKSPAPAAT